MHGRFPDPPRPAWRSRRKAPGTLKARLRRAAVRFGLGRALSLLLLVALVALRVWDPPPVEAVRLRTFDAFQALQPRVPAPGGPVAIVDLDEASMRELGQWPWPRTRIAELVSRLAGMGAILIAFDVVFAEPDRLSPGLLADALPGLDERTREALRGLPTNDAVLAEAMRGARVVLGQTALGEAAAAPAEPPPETPFAFLGPNPTAFLPTFPGLLRNVPVLEAAAVGRGLFTITPEADGIVRRVPVVLMVDGKPAPTLALEIVRVLTGAGPVIVRSDAGGVQRISLPGFELPTDGHGQVWIHFHRHDRSRFTSAAEVLAGRAPPERFRNKVVLVGTSAIGLLDLKTTPLDRAMPGVEVHAQLLESALAGVTLTAPSYAAVVEIGVALAVSFALVLFAPIVGAVTLLLLGAAVAAALAAASWYRFSRFGVLLDPTFPLLSSFSVYLTLVFTNYLREQLGRARIRSAFGQYLSPALVEQLAQSPERLRLGGEERTLTVMFSDVRGFTTISESYKHDPQGLTALMNRFLTPLTNAILERKGTVDKYMGDAIMAFWNAPLDDARHQANACLAALAMLARLDRLNEARRAEAAAAGTPFLPLHAGIGLNTGRCIVGNMGSDLRFDYSALGDSVNLASRLEGQSKLYGASIVLGSATAAAVADELAAVEIDRVRVKGKTEPETVWTLLGDGRVRASAPFEAFRRDLAALLAAYRGRDWDRADALAASLRPNAAAFGIEGLCDLYAGRVAACRASPPPEGWDGVHVASTK